jgi:hypothetical protein
MCFVTGYPVAPHDRVMCKACKMPANKHDWNKYIHRCQTCPLVHGSSTTSLLVYTSTA